MCITHRAIIDVLTGGEASTSYLASITGLCEASVRLAIQRLRRRHHYVITSSPAQTSAIDGRHRVWTLGSC